MPVEFGFSAVGGDDIWIPDHQFLHRIRTAYRLTTAKYKQPIGTMWAVIGERRRPIHDALMADDDERLAQILANPAESELYYGIDTLSHVSTVDLKAPTDAAGSQIALTISNHFISLAEAVGARPLWNPEGQTARCGIENSDAMLSAIESAIGSEIRCPNPFPGEFGLRTSRGVLAYKVPMAIYQAHKLRSLSRMANGARILEIGAGMGRTAYYAKALGLTDYTTVDIPMGIVAQACFLAAALGPDSIWMAGDPPARNSGKIRLLAPDDLEASADRFDIILNADSLTEMSFEQALFYFQYSLANAKILFSINHEANSFRVGDLPAAAHFAGCSLRHISTMRPGYVEEYFFSDRTLRRTSMRAWAAEFRTACSTRLSFAGWCKKSRQGHDLDARLRRRQCGAK